MAFRKTPRAVRIAALLIAASLPSAGTALADGDSRVATAQEKEFHSRVRQVVARAVPPPPPGWAVDSGDDRLDRVPTESEKYPFRVTWNAVWEDKKRIEAESMAMQMKMVEAIGNTPPEKMEAVVNEMTRAMTPRDVLVRINVSVNNLSESFPPRTVESGLVAGAPSCRREGESGQAGWREPITWVFLGDGWTFHAGGPYMEKQPAQGVPSLAVQGIVVRIEGDAARTKGIIEKTDWAALKGLLRR